MDGVALGHWRSLEPAPPCREPSSFCTKVSATTGSDALGRTEAGSAGARWLSLPVLRYPGCARGGSFLIRKAYPSALRWGDRNVDQHAGFQAMWLQYDHLLPH